MDYYEMELGKAARVLVEEMLAVKHGETFVITADTESDRRVVNATAQSAFAVGAKPMVIWLAAPMGVGKAADPMLPVDALSEALKQADVWAEFNNKWLLYSTPFERAVFGNDKIRYINLVGMNVDMMTRLIGRVDMRQLATFMYEVRDLTKKARKVRVTTPTGTHLEFENNPEHPISCDVGKADVPGIHYLPGQIGWTPELQTIEGTLVFDGSIVPPCGLLTEPVRITVEKGRAVKIEGGRQAAEFRKWLASFNDPHMFRLAHICYGFNPGAILSGNIVEDERVWGATEWGLGYQSAKDCPPNGIPAVSHTDGICLNSSVWLDGVQLLNEGVVIDEYLKELAEEITQEARGY